MDITLIILGWSAIVAAVFIALDVIAARRSRFGGHVFDRRDQSLKGRYRRADWLYNYKRFAASTTSYMKLNKWRN